MQPNLTIFKNDKSDMKPSSWGEKKDKNVLQHAITSMNEMLKKLSKYVARETISQWNRSRLYLIFRLDRA